MPIANDLQLMKIRYIHYLLAIILLFCAACSDEHKYRIAVSQCSQDDWRQKMNDEIEREMLFHEDAVVEIRSADDSSARQIEDLRYFIDNDFDVLIVSPNEAETLTPIIKEAYEKKIPVILFDRNIIGDTYTTHIGADNVGLGNAAAEYARSILPHSPTAIELQGLTASTPAQGRHSGFADTFRAYGGEIIASVPANWKSDVAERVTDSLLRLYPDIDLIYAHNDRMAIGASEVTRRLGLDRIKIIGIDAAPEIGIQAVADSIIDASFFYPTEGHLLIRTALDILNGKEVEKNIILPGGSVVDHSNANILLMQNKALHNETDRMQILKEKIDEYWSRHSSQTYLFYACLVIIILLCGVVFLILRAHWQHKRHQIDLIKQNKMLEEQRDREHQLNEKLNAATQSKLMFFTNVSHDLRTPLTLIAEPVAQLAEADNLTPQQHSLIKIADKNVRILRRLINQILDFRKYENDKLSLNLEETDVAGLLGEWIESFHALAHKRHIKLTTDISPDSGTIAIDIEKMERVIFNIVSNAFKYTPDNGEIHITYHVEGEKAIISVSDTGQGIAERDLGNIFERFYQADRVHPNGSGIGLTLSKAFVELHDGEINVESQLMKGSTFTISIPIRHVAVSALSWQPAITPEVVEAELTEIENDMTFEDDKELLLVIDDNNDIRVMLKELLGDTYNIITASGGADGIRKATKYVPDLILCDVMMPGMDGLECCHRLKEEISTSHIPVLLLTACSMDEQRVQGLDSGADAYIAKPFSTAVLKAQISSLIQNRKRINNINVQTTGASLPNVPADSKSKTQRPKSDIDNDFYNKFLDIFNTEISNPDISVDILASRMGLERTQFYRKIKALTNYSPVELIRTLRLRHARHLLLSTDKSISEISYDSGFSSPAYFTRCYRETYNETPSETRANIRH